MKWQIVDDTLIIKGRFYAISSGILGGWGYVNFLFNHCVKNNELWNPAEYIKSIAKRFKMDTYFGLLTAVSMDKLSVKKEKDVTVFTTAGLRNPNEELKIGTINIIVVVDADVKRSAMINAIITATEAKSMALFEEGYNFTGTNTDAVIVSKTCRKGRVYEYAGASSVLGRKIWNCVKKSVKESLSK